MGTNPPTKYTDEFRRETADYVISSGRPIAECCRELAGKPNPAAEDRELREARRRIRELVMENAFLKKPTPSSLKSRRRRALPLDGGGEGEFSCEGDGPRARGEQIRLHSG